MPFMRYQDLCGQTNERTNGRSQLTNSLKTLPNAFVNTAGWRHCYE